MKINIPPGAARILRTLRRAGFEAHIVGGCVRDSLMGREPKDWDITTSARPEEVKALFKKTVDTGIAHGTVTVRSDGDSFEVTTWRVDGEYTDHRHPDRVTFTGRLSDDLERRDFTINAMAWNDEEGIIDLFGGRADLEAGVIRAVGDPEKRFTEDALRMMRAVRFSAQLGFTVEENTRSAIRALAPTLSAVSMERVRDELHKLLVSAHPDRIGQLHELGLTAVFLPEFDEMMKTPQNNPHHSYHVGGHTIAALCACVEISRREELSPDDDRLLRLAILLHDVAKPGMRTTDAEGIDHFRGHPQAGAKLAEEILTRFKEDNRTIARVKNLISLHDLRPASDARSVRRTAARAGREDFPLLLDVMEADVRGQSNFLRQEKLTRLTEIRAAWKGIREAQEAISLPDLAVTGRDLIAHGMQPGPAIGEKLNEMLEEVLDDPSHNTREYLLEHFV